MRGTPAADGHLLRVPSHRRSSWLLVRCVILTSRSLATGRWLQIRMRNEARSPFLGGSSVEDAGHRKFTLIHQSLPACRHVGQIVVLHPESALTYQGADLRR